MSSTVNRIAAVGSISECLFYGVSCRREKSALGFNQSL